MPRNSVAYDDDFFAWTMEQARLLREGAVSEIDTLNLAEEIESMGKNNRRELGTRLAVLLMHLLLGPFAAGQRDFLMSIPAVAAISTIQIAIVVAALLLVERLFGVKNLMFASR